MEGLSYGKLCVRLGNVAQRKLLVIDHVAGNPASYEKSKRSTAATVQRAWGLKSEIRRRFAVRSTGDRATVRHAGARGGSLQIGMIVFKIQLRHNAPMAQNSFRESEAAVLLIGSVWSRNPINVMCAVPSAFCCVPCSCQVSTQQGAVAIAHTVACG